MTSKSTVSNEMVVSKHKKKVSCSTPKHRTDSPSKDSDSLCDSDPASPVPFLCTQDGIDGETDVIWNHYTPKTISKKRHYKNNRNRRSRKSLQTKILENPLPKQNNLKVLQNKNKLLKELEELNKNLSNIIKKSSVKNSVSERENFEDDIFNESLEFSPKRSIKNNHSLRKNVLSSKFPKFDPDNGFDSDDSINECLIKASQMLENNTLKYDVLNVQTNDMLNEKMKPVIPSISFKIDDNSMDAIINSIKTDSPCAKRLKECEFPQSNNDSFDGLLGNLNDSTIERLTQTSSKTPSLVMETQAKTKKPLESVINCGIPTAKSTFSRHNSMPESPSTTHVNKPATSGMSFSRYSSMPVDKNVETDLSDSPIRCTPEEIKKKHQLAREKLLAKRQLPFTATQSSNLPIPVPEVTVTCNSKSKFQLKVPSNKAFDIPKNTDVKPACENLTEKCKTRPTAMDCNDTDIKSIIEKKRQEALQKLRLKKAKPLT